MNYRNTWAEINLAAIGHNIRQLKNNLPEGHRDLTVLKADSYRHGSIQLPMVAIQAGIDFFIVALLEEANKIRNAGIDIPILVIGRVSPQHVEVAANYNITLTVFD